MVRAPDAACPAVAWAAVRASPAKVNIRIATHGARPPMSRMRAPPASWVPAWVGVVAVLAGAVRGR